VGFTLCLAFITWLFFNRLAANSPHWRFYQFLDVWVSFVDLIGDLRMSPFFAMENNFSILSRGKNKISCLKIGSGLKFEIF